MKKGKKKGKRSDSSRIETVMRFSLILGVLLLTIISATIVQAKCTCGNLGSGVNPCKCSKTVVKAAKPPKSLHHASPKAIEEAARETTARLSAGLSTGATPYFRCGLCAGRIHQLGDRSPSFLERLINKIRSLRLSAPHKTIPTPGSGCGCRKESELSLKMDVSSRGRAHGQIVPRFRPIGDMCRASEPSGHEHSMIRGGVIPARPPKLKCCPSSPQHRRRVCLHVRNGQIDQAGLRKLGLLTSFEGETGGLGLSDESSDFGDTLDGYAVPGVAAGGLAVGDRRGDLGDEYSEPGSLGSDDLGAYGYHGPDLAGRYDSGGVLGGGFYADAGADNNLAGGQPGLPGIDGFGGHDTVRPDVEIIAESPGPIERIDRLDDDVEVPPENYAYHHHLPTDPVSLGLAYGNLFSRVVQNDGGAFVPEDKLAFGHRSVPIELAPIDGESTASSYVPEERLQMIGGPVVELRPLAPIPADVRPVYDEAEEVGLTELEAIERERMNQDAIAGQSRGYVIAYGDLGYGAPVDGALPRTASDCIDAGNDIVEGGYGTIIAPSFPVPGVVVIDRELARRTGGSEELPLNAYVPRYSKDEDIDDTVSSVILARLRSAARNYGSAVYHR